MSQTQQSPPGRGRVVFTVILVAVVAGALGAMATWFLMSLKEARVTGGPTPAPTAPAPTTTTVPPTTLAAATPAPPPVSVAEAPPPPSLPSGPAGPAAPPGPPKVKKILTEAESAAGKGKFKEAGSLYAEALKLDPSNPQARAWRAAVDSLNRSFAMGITEAESLKGVSRDLKGFDATGIGVKRMPDQVARLQIEIEPPRLRPGQPYNVSVYLQNDDKAQAIELDELKIAMTSDGKRTAVPVTPQVASVGPQKKALVAELPGTWSGGSAWAMEVVLTSKRQDVYKNRLDWK